MKKILILINPMSTIPTEDELDVLTQVCFVEEILESLGYTTFREFVDMNFTELKNVISRIDPDIIFNMVENMDNNARILFLSTGLLDNLSYPYTGNHSTAMFLTNDKVLAKEVMALAGIPTPDWYTSSALNGLNDERTFVAKPIWEDASVGIDDYSIFRGSPGNIRNYRRRFGSDEFFLEEFIEGREMNISVIEFPDGPKVLQPAEILFSHFPIGKPKIVGYQAKWNPASFEYKNTTRTFDLSKEDVPLVVKLEELAYQCWDVFHLRGYARVDFRIDEKGNPFVLEINANPCLSADAGFRAACNNSEISDKKMIKLILNAAKK